MCKRMKRTRTRTRRREKWLQSASEPLVAPGACVHLFDHHPPVKSSQFHLSWNTAPGAVSREIWPAPLAVGALGRSRYPATSRNRTANRCVPGGFKDSPSLKKVLITRRKVDFKNRFHRYAPYRFVPPARLCVIARQSSDSGPLFVSSYVVSDVSERVSPPPSPIPDLRTRKPRHFVLVQRFERRIEIPKLSEGFGNSKATRYYSSSRLARRKKGYRATCLSTFHCLHNAKNLIKPRIEPR